MKSDDRFYQMEFTHRPAMWGDIGSQLRIQGLVVGGVGAQTVAMLPGESFDGMSLDKRFGAITMTVDEWSEFIRRSDDPEILVGPAKVFQRKMRYAISGAVQQKIWAADGFKCVYCGQPMGKVLLTIDHFIPLEEGGKNDTSNYLSSCKMCNKQKGSRNAKEFCDEKGCDYEFLVAYLDHREVK